MAATEIAALVVIVLAGLALFLFTFALSLGRIEQAVAELSGEVLSATEEREP